jgi:hypothetical protein
MYQDNEDIIIIIKCNMKIIDLTFSLFWSIYERFHPVQAVVRLRRSLVKLENLTSDASLLTIDLSCLFPATTQLFHSGL